LLLLPSVFLKYDMSFLKSHAIIKKKRHTGCIEKRGEHDAYRRIRCSGPGSILLAGPGLRAMAQTERGFSRY
jgi:hypothetical protein